MNRPVEITSKEDSEEIPASITRRGEIKEENGKSVGRNRFSTEAYTILERSISSFTFELVREAGHLAKRDKADSISAHHIEKANSYLANSSTNRWDSHQGIFGGVVFGVGIAAMFSMIVTSNFSQLGVFLAAVTIIVGAYFITAKLTK